MCTPMPPSAGGRSPPAIPSGKAIKRRCERGVSTNPAPVAAFHQLGGSASRPSEVAVGARPKPETAPRWLRFAADARDLPAACAPWPAGARASRGSKGAEPPSPAPAGDPRSVAPKGRLAHDC